MVSYTSSAVLALAALASSTVGALELTTDTFSEMTAGKTVFLKMYAPWCGHCKAMAADWSKGEQDFDGHAVAFVGSVDCTKPDNMEICQSADVQGYPTLVWGDVSALKPYDGGRDYASLKAFADEKVTKPVCSVHNQDPCTDEEKAAIEAVGKLTDDELVEVAKKVFEAEKAANKEFEEILEKLQQTFEEEQEKIDATISALKKETNYGYVSAIMKKRGVANPFSDMDLDDDDDDLTEGEL